MKFNKQNLYNNNFLDKSLIVPKTFSLYKTKESKSSKLL